tara:strand:+ start:240 stop:995 length:756 start_codon:yes stop_codon:yes gene_type:complete
MVRMTLIALLTAAATSFQLLGPVHPHSRARAAVRACELPMEPVPGLTAEDACKIICEGLQYNDKPSKDSGIERLYHWMTGPGRVSVAPPPPKAGLQGYVSLEYFMEEAAAPAIGALMDCTRFELVGEPTVTPGNQNRGRLATQQIHVFNDPPDMPSHPVDAALTAMVVAPDSYLESVLAAAREGRPAPPAPLLPGASSAAQIPPISRFLFSLEEERRPPHQGCWFLKELYHMKKTKFQVLNEGGEEFGGED